MSSIGYETYKHYRFKCQNCRREQLNRDNAYMEKVEAETQEAPNNCFYCGGKAPKGQEVCEECETSAGQKSAETKQQQAATSARNAEKSWD